MNNDVMISTADLILTAAIEDYACRTNRSAADVRDEIIESGACDALYDFETGLWTQGPDYFIDFFLKKKSGIENAV
ncbi:MAG: hypothetical protein MJ095_02380 [Oscillospiraceae bacterium]|nr:hypothetical protein [Oscillospiraceae bacterium]